MSDVYQFSKSSLPLLERCISVASQPDSKWMKLFKPDTRTEDGILQGDDSASTMLIPYESPHQLSSELETEAINENKEQKQQEIDVEKIRAFLETAGTNKLEYLLQQQVTNDNLLPALAEKLSLECMKRIFNDLFNSSYIDSNFVRKLLLYFFPAYIKEENSCVTLELLFRAYKSYSNEIIPLMESLCMGTSIPSNVLEEFFTMTDVTTRSQFLQSLSFKVLTPEAFVHHLNTIKYLYKNSQKTFEVHNFIFNFLKICSHQCRGDVSYGKLMLLFIQGVRDSNASMSITALDQLVNDHETAYKNPCLAILNNLG